MFPPCHAWQIPIMLTYTPVKNRGYIAVSFQVFV